MTDRVATSPQIFRPDEMPFIERGNGARTIPLTTTAVGATSFLNGITTFEPGAEIAHHTHNCIESVMIIEGEAIVDIDGVETPLTTHDTTFVPANIPHRFKNASSEKRMRILWTYASIDATRTLVASGRDRAHRRRTAVGREPPARGRARRDRSAAGQRGCVCGRCGRGRPALSEDAGLALVRGVHVA